MEETFARLAMLKCCVLRIAIYLIRLSVLYNYVWTGRYNSKSLLLFFFSREEESAI